MQTEKIQLLQTLKKTEDWSLIKEVWALVKARTQESDFWDELHDDVKKDVEEGLAELDRGEGIPGHVVMRKHEQWLKK